MEENIYLKTYTNYLLKNKISNNKTTEKYIKPNKNFHFSTSNLYYYFDNNQEDSFDKINEIILANLNLYKQDLYDDLDSTDNLYEVNDDGSYLLSIIN